MTTNKEYDNTLSVIDKSSVICDCLSDYAKSNKEYVIVCNLVQIWAQSCLYEKVIREICVKEVSEQLSKIDAIIYMVSHHYLFDKLNLGKCTICSNEYIHHNYKYGSGKVKPNFQITTTVKGIT